MLPKGIRQKNPGNIRYSDRNKWQGAARQPEGEPFCFFNTPVWGLRALAVLLITYYDRYDADTIEKIIERFAPDHENPTADYVAHVSRKAAIPAGEVINLHDYATLLGIMRGIVTFENGDPAKFGWPANWYPQENYDEALKRAGVVPPSRVSLAGQDVAQGATVATVGVAALWETGRQLIGNKDTSMQHVGAGLLCVAALASVVAWWRHQRARRAEVL